MSDQKVPYNNQASTVIAANGTGQVQFQATGTDLEITFITLSLSSQALQPQAFVYRNYVGDQYMVDSTYSGAKATSDTTHILTDGERLIISWQGADVGATANVFIRGWQFVPYRGFRSVV